MNRESESADREAIRSMVEDFWRAFLATARHRPDVARKTVLSFDERTRATAALMAPDRARQFLQAVNEERAMLLDEFRVDAEGLQRRLGLTVSRSPERGAAAPRRAALEAAAGCAVPPSATAATAGSRWRSVMALFPAAAAGCRRVVKS